MATMYFVRNGQTGETKKVNATQIGEGPEWQAQCPFHQSEGLKLKLNVDKGTWHCMSCGATGKVVDGEEAIPDAVSMASPVKDEIDWEHPVREHVYRSVTGEPLTKIIVYRYKMNTKKKACILYTFINGTWARGLGKLAEQGKHLVPYNLDKLADRPDLPVFIHEGEKDCDTMAQVSNGEMLGTTNPLGASKWKDEYSEYLRDRDVYLIPDNDPAGYRHMRQVGESVRKVARSVKLILLPGLEDNDSKDFSDWIEDGHTLEEFKHLVEEAPAFDPQLLSKYEPASIDFDGPEEPSGKTDVVVKERLTGDQLADFILEDKFTQDGLTILKYHGGAFSVYNGKCYLVHDRDMLRSIIDTYLRQELLAKRGVAVPISFNLKEEIIRSLKDRQGVLMPSDIKLPYWQISDPPTTGQVLVLNNGILPLERLVTGQACPTKAILVPHDPRLFATCCLPYDYDPDALCPRWLQFLDETFPDDPESIAFLQEWFGYNLTNENHMKAFLVLEGPTNSGKSVIMNVLTALLGDQNVSHVPLIDFKNDFKLIDIYGKMANVCSEIRSTGTNCEQMLKCITGGDMITLNKKFEQPMNFLPTIKITFSTNDHPHWDEKSGALYTRLKVLRCERSIPEGQQDKRLTSKLKEELAGIFRWSMEGLKRLWATNVFTASRKSQEAVDRQRQDSDSAWGFASECLVAQKDGLIKVDDLYEQYKTWTLGEGFRSPLKKAKFCEVLRERFPETHKRRLGPSARRAYYFDGLVLAYSVNEEPDARDLQRGITKSGGLRIE